MVKTFPHRPDIRRERAQARAQKKEQVPKSTPKDFKPKAISPQELKSRLNNPPFGFVISLGRVTWNPAPQLYELSDLLSAHQAWVEHRLKQKQDIIPASDFSVDLVPITFAKGRHTGRIIPEGFVIYGIVRHPVRKSRPMLKEMLAWIAGKLNQSVIQLHFTQVPYVYEVRPVPPDGVTLVRV